VTKVICFDCEIVGIKGKTFEKLPYVLDPVEKIYVALKLSTTEPQFFQRGSVNAVCNSKKSVLGWSPVKIISVTRERRQIVPQNDTEWPPTLHCSATSGGKVYTPVQTDVSNSKISLNSWR
jgi:hypothetical protein